MLKADPSSAYPPIHLSRVPANKPCKRPISFEFELLPAAAAAARSRGLLISIVNFWFDKTSETNFLFCFLHGALGFIKPSSVGSHPSRCVSQSRLPGPLNWPVFTNLDPTKPAQPAQTSPAYTCKICPRIREYSPNCYRIVNPGTPADQKKHCDSNGNCAHRLRSPLFASISRTIHCSTGSAWVFLLIGLLAIEHWTNRTGLQVGTCMSGSANSRPRQRCRNIVAGSRTH